MTTPCEKTEVIQYIRQDVSEIKGDVKSLLAYQNKLIGIVVGITSVLTIGFNLITFYFKK